jgi:hypothetical protein
VSVRVYLPTTLEQLAVQYAAGEVVVPDGTVTAADDREETEYAALMAAAAASADLLRGPGRRVVVVAELDAEPGTGQAVPLRDVVAVHADTEDRPADADPDEDLAWFATQEIEYLL